jgi:16S rRNA (guanine966-N2)-methyltransferase
MRVIAGRYGGLRLQAPKGDATRPTSDRVREALFSILGSRVEGAEVLDLFAGSGALGIEALSRGAAHVDFVDKAGPALRQLKGNLQALRITAEADVHSRDAKGFLQPALERRRHYDLVFLDPPYRLASRLGTELAQPLRDVLAPGGIVISESDRRAPLDLELLPVHDERRYGDTLIRIHGA